VLKIPYNIQLQESLQYSFIYIHQKFYACHIPTQTHWENVPAVDTTLLLARFMTFFSKWNFQWAVLKTCSDLSETDECESGNVFITLVVFLQFVN